MPSKKKGTGYLLHKALEGREDGIIFLNDKYIVRVATKGGKVKTIAQFNSKEEADDCYNKLKL